MLRIARAPPLRAVTPSVRGVLRAIRACVSGDERHCCREPAMGDRYARVGRGGHARCHTGGDLERDTCLAQRQRLLAAAPEHERVAALQPHDAQPGPRASEHQRLGLLLRNRLTAALLAHEQQLGIRARAPSSAEVGIRRS